MRISRLLAGGLVGLTLGLGGVLAADLVTEPAEAQRGSSQFVTKAEFNAANKSANQRASAAINGYKIANNALTKYFLKEGELIGAGSGPITQDRGTGANGLPGSTIQDGAIDSRKIAPGGVTSGDLADGSVTNPKLQAGAVSTAKIGVGAVTGEKIADDAVTQAKVADRAVGPAQLDTPIAGGFGFGGAVSLADNVSQLLPVGQTPDFALGGLTVSSGKVVAPRAGVYEITAVVAFLHNANGGWRQLAIRHTTSSGDLDQTVSRVVALTAPGSFATFVTGTRVVAAQAGDSFGAVGLQRTDPASNLNANVATFSVSYIGPLAS